jgi:hypothetical protein
MYVSVLRHDTLTYFWAAGHPSPSSERVVADEDTQVGQQLPLASGRGRPDRAGAGDRGTNQSCRACRSATTHRGPGSRPRRSRAGSAGRPRWWQEALRGVRGSRRCWTGRRGGHRDHCRSDDCAESGEQATAEVLERIEPRHGALLDCEGFSPWFGAAAAVGWVIEATSRTSRSMSAHDVVRRPGAGEGVNQAVIASRLRRAGQNRCVLAVAWVFWGVAAGDWSADRRSGCRAWVSGPWWCAWVVRGLTAAAPSFGATCPGPRRPPPPG